MPREGQIGPISLFSSQIKKSQDLSSSPGGVMNFIDGDDNLGIPWVDPGIPKSTQWVPSAVGIPGHNLGVPKLVILIKKS